MKTSVKTTTDIEDYENALKGFNWYYDIHIDNATWRSDEDLYRRIKEYARDRGLDYQRLFNKYYSLAFSSHFKNLQVPFPHASYPAVDTTTETVILSTKSKR